MGTADIHIHSLYSYDATTTVKAVLKQAADAGLDVIAITDHDEIRGSLEARALAPKYGLEAIPAVEVSTKDGHLLALFVEELPPPGLPLVETLLCIGQLGGIAVAPHPFNPLPASLSMEVVVHALTQPGAKEILKGIETYNMSTQAFDKLAQKLSVYLPLAKTASSDAHVYWAIGAGRTEFEGAAAKDLKKAIENNTTVPIPYEGDFSAKEILGWVRRMALRRFGYASDSTSAATPVDTQKIDLERVKMMVQKRRRKE